MFRQTLKPDIRAIKFFFLFYLWIITKYFLIFNFLFLKSNARLISEGKNWFDVINENAFFSFLKGVLIIEMKDIEFFF